MSREIIGTNGNCSLDWDIRWPSFWIELARSKRISDLAAVDPFNFLEDKLFLKRSIQAAFPSTESVRCIGAARAIEVASKTVQSSKEENEIEGTTKGLPVKFTIPFRI